MKTDRKKINKLFLSTFYLSACTFGGGYVIVSFMKQIFVDDLHWIEEDEMLDLIAIAQSAPGPVAVNGAIVVGYKIARFPGAAAATLGAVLPPFIILSVITGIYQIVYNNPLISALLHGMQAGVAAIIASVTLDMTMGLMKKSEPAAYRCLAAVILIAAFIANYFFHVGAPWIILICGVFGVIKTVISDRFNSARKEEDE